MVRARKGRGWTQTELAVASEVSLSTVMRTENAVRTPRTSEAQRMAAQLGMSLEELLAVSELVEQPTTPSPSPTPARRRKPTPKAPGTLRARTKHAPADVAPPRRRPTKAVA